VGIGGEHMLSDKM